VAVPDSVPRKRKPLRGLVVFLIAVVVASSTLIAAAAWSVRIPVNMAGPLRVASVAYTPANPVPGQGVVVTAEVAGSLVSPLVATVQFAAYFGTIESGSVPMTPIGQRTYTAALPEFPDGTEVWFVVAASWGDASPVISGSYTVNVGTVLREGPSGLSVDDVRHSPAQPRRYEPITIDASVSSRSPVTEVAVAYMAFCPQRPVPIDPPMFVVAPNHYTITIEPLRECEDGTAITFLYRVLAIDATGNTAVSPVGLVSIQ